MEVKGVWKKSVLLLVAALLCPLALVVWLVYEGLFPKHKVTSMFRSPFVRFSSTPGPIRHFYICLQSHQVPVIFWEASRLVVRDIDEKKFITVNTLS